MKGAKAPFYKILYRYASKKGNAMQHEQSLADIFNDYMKRQAFKNGCAFHSFSLDGQDRDIGADYLLTDSDQFSIIEFKYTDENLASENKKERRLVLCKKLIDDEVMKGYHDKCHFISWSDKISLEIKTNVYRHEICNKSVFGKECGLPSKNPNVDSRRTLKSFSKNFFDRFDILSLSREQFEEYVTWVLQETSGSTRTTLQLIAYNPDSGSLALVKMNSLKEAQKWVMDHFTPPKNNLRP